MEFIRTISVPLSIFGLIIFTLYAIKWLTEFFQEQRYLKTQIIRCGNTAEKKRLEKLLRRFYISKIPIVGYILIRFIYR